MFAVVAVDNMTAGSVSIRPLRMHHNYYFDERTGIDTSVPVGDCGLVGPLVHHVRHNNVERAVQPSAARAQPFDLHRNRPPSLLKARSLPLIHRLPQVERATIPEVEPGPQQGGHVCFGKPHRLIVGEWSIP